MGAAALASVAARPTHKSATDPVKALLAALEAAADKPAHESERTGRAGGLEQVRDTCGRAQKPVAHRSSRRPGSA